MDESRQYAARARMKQANETLEEAKTLFEQDFWRGTINRAYYAMFYAVLALAASKGVVISKHTHAISFLDKEFVNKGIFPKEISRALHINFDERQTNDYGEIWDVNSDEAKEILKEAKWFVKTLKDYIDKQ
ncbi:MAG: HEPN domain-containing protein [Chloroflexi bacterium]|nr:HEPN domain-containing protein [Chloroflexota bacterium]